MQAPDTRLTDLGWTPFFAAQVTVGDEAANLRPFRVMSVHRGQIAVAGAGSERLVSPRIAQAVGEEAHATVGDWLLIDDATSQVARILDRANLFRRRTPGNVRKVQLIAANVDTLFIVASCNQDFNLARLERYLVMARDVGVEPVVVLTKADLTAAPWTFADEVRGLQPDIRVETINAKDADAVARLGAWCGRGKTVALMGSSGVGKSTLIKSLTGLARIATGAVREGDGKGRHTTTVRELHRLDHGGWLMDTPGMRELHLSDAGEGVAEVFDDILLLGRDCRFSDCAHGKEPGCAVRAALAAGEIDPVRFDRWLKLRAENAGGTGPGRWKRSSATRG